MMLNLTKKQLRLKTYNDIIDKNKNNLKPGTTLDRDEFAKLFKMGKVPSSGNYRDVHRANLRLVGVQAEVNMLLRENGLYMKSSNYYGEFTVVTKELVKSTVERFSREVDVYSACTSRLIDNVDSRSSAGTWGTYSSVPVSTIATMGQVTPSLRHTRTVSRLKTI